MEGFAEEDTAEECGTSRRTVAEDETLLDEELVFGRTRYGVVCVRAISTVVRKSIYVP